jgi:type IV secretion system protein TrbL
MIHNTSGVFDPLSPKARKLIFWIGVAALFFSAATAHAQTQILDNIAQSYKTASAGWTSTLLSYANRLFRLLAIIEFTWSCAVWALEKNEYQSFVAAIVKKFMWIGTFYMILLNGPTWIPAIIDSFTDAGIAASGSGGLSPSEVFTTGLDNAATMLEGIKNMSLWDDMGVIIVAGLSGLAIVIAFAIIAGQLLVALVESYIAISAGLLFLGFGGSRWTTDFVQKYIGYAMATGVKLFMLFLIIGIGNSQAQTWKAMLLTIGTPGVPAFNIILSVLGGSVLLAYLAMQIPAQAASMLAGSPSLTAGAAASSAGMMAAGVIGAGAAGAAATIGGAKSGGGLAKAVGAAWGEAGAQGHSGIGRAVATLGNLGTAAATDTGQRIEQAVAPTKGGRMADISTGRAGEIAAATTPAAGVPTVPPPAVPSSNPTQGAQASAPSGQGTPAGSSDASSGGAAAPTAAAEAPGGQSQAAPAGSAAADASAGAAASAAPEAAGGQADAPAASGGAQQTAAAAAPAGDASTSSGFVDRSAVRKAASSASPAAGGGDVAAAGAPSGPPGGFVDRSLMRQGGAGSVPASTPAMPSGDGAATPAAAAPAGPVASAPAGGVDGAQASTSPATAGQAAAPASPPAVPQGSAPAENAPSGPAAASAGQGGAGMSPPIGGMPAPAGVVEQAQGPKAPGFEDRFRDLSQVRPPQLPNDGAPSATVSIRFDTPHD